MKSMAGGTRQGSSRPGSATRRLVLVLVVLGAGWGCDKKDQAKQEDLTIVVEADRSKIAKEEQKLQAQVAEMEKEKETLLRERSELTQAKEQNKGLDKVQEARLLESERRLLEKERSIRTREASLDSERTAIQTQKQDLEKKAPGALGADLPIREKGLADREKGLAGREAELARREKDLAQREADLAARETAFIRLQGSAVTTAARTPAGRIGGQTVTRDQAEKAHKAALNKMRQKGILWADLPPEGTHLQGDLAAAQKKGDGGRLLDLAEQLDGLVSSIQIDSDFINRKLQWLTKLRKDKNPSAADSDTVKNLLRTVTLLVGDGKYAAANQELNRIHALLSH